MDEYDIIISKTGNHENMQILKRDNIADEIVLDLAFRGKFNVKDYRKKSE